MMDILFIYKDIEKKQQIVSVVNPCSPLMDNFELIGILKLTTQIIEVKDCLLKIDYKAKINFDKDYVHCPDTSMFNGFAYGKISKVAADRAAQTAGFKFYKIIAADKSLKLDIQNL